MPPPPVYHPSSQIAQQYKSPLPPPVYRPQSTASQPSGLQQRPAPPVYRPAAAQPSGSAQRMASLQPPPAWNQPRPKAPVFAARPPLPAPSSTLSVIQPYRTKEKPVPSFHGRGRDEMAKEMAMLRSVMEGKNDGTIKHEEYDDEGLKFLPGTQPHIKTREVSEGVVEGLKVVSYVPDEKTKRRVPNERKVFEVKRSLASRRPPPVVLGISNRPGFGYDQHSLRNMKTTKSASLPPGFAALDKAAPTQRQDQEKQWVIRERIPAEFSTGMQNPLTRGLLIRGGEDRETEGIEDKEFRERYEKALAEKVSTHITQSRISGIFIPGGQDREEDGSPEKASRALYEKALVEQARLRGIPMLAVCGGSRALAVGYGGQEKLLSGEKQLVHQKKGMGEMAHGISFPDPHTLVGGTGGYRKDQQSGKPKYVPLTQISKVNSTHVKVVDFTNTNKLPTGQSELVISALDPTGEPEGFETRHGAPVIGITSHPEAIFGTSSRNTAPSDFQQWSDKMFFGFQQSMAAYSGRQDVNRSIERPTGLAEQLIRKNLGI